MASGSNGKTGKQALGKTQAANRRGVVPKYTAQQKRNLNIRNAPF